MKSISRSGRTYSTEGSRMLFYWKNFIQLILGLLAGLKQLQSMYIHLFFLLLIVLCSTHTKTGITHSSDIILLNYPRFTVNLCMCVLCRSDSDTLKCKIVFSLWQVYNIITEYPHNKT